MMNQSFLHVSLALCARVLKRYGKASSGSMSIEYALLAASMLGGVTVGAVQIKEDLNKGYGDVSDIIEEYPKAVDVSKLSTQASSSGSGGNNNSSIPTQVVKRTSEVDSILFYGSSQLDGTYGKVVLASGGGYRPGHADYHSTDEDVLNRAVYSSSHFGYDSDGNAVNAAHGWEYDDNGNKKNIAYLLDDDNQYNISTAFSALLNDNTPYVYTFNLKQRSSSGSASGGQGDSLVDVYHDGQLIDTIRPPRDAWETYSYAVLGEGKFVELAFAERDASGNQRSDVLLDNVYIESGEFVNGGPEMTFTGTRANDDVTVTFGNLQGTVIDKEAVEPVSNS